MLSNVCEDKIDDDGDLGVRGWLGSPACAAPPFTGAESSFFINSGLGRHGGKGTPSVGTVFRLILEFLDSEIPE